MADCVGIVGEFAFLRPKRTVLSPQVGVGTVVLWECLDLRLSLGRRPRTEDDLRPPKKRHGYLEGQWWGDGMLTSTHLTLPSLPMAIVCHQVAWAGKQVTKVWCARWVRSKRRGTISFDQENDKDSIQI